jgi:hypothetical protein
MPIILPVVLYGCGTWSLTLREEHRLRMFHNSLLRRLFGPKRDEVMGDSRKQHNEEIRNLCSSPNIIRMIRSRRMRWTGHVARLGEKRNPYMILVGKTEGRKPLGRPRYGWVDNNKIDLRKIEWNDMDWNHLAQDRDQWRPLVNMVMNLLVPYNAGTFLSICTTGSFSRRAHLRK